MMVFNVEHTMRWMSIAGLAACNGTGTDVDSDADTLFDGEVVTETDFVVEPFFNFPTVALCYSEASGLTLSQDCLTVGSDEATFVWGLNGSPDTLTIIEGSGMLEFDTFSSGTLIEVDDNGAELVDRQLVVTPPVTDFVLTGLNEIASITFTVTGIDPPVFASFEARYTLPE